LAIYSNSSILAEDDVQFLLDLLPKFNERTPDIYIIDKWETIANLIDLEENLFERYSLLKKIVKNSVFSTYNYKYNMIFIYLFNLPYRDPFLRKLHGVFCLFHEMRHHQQFIFDRNGLTTQNLKPPAFTTQSSYSFSWVEKDANKHAVKWMRRNRKAINSQLKLHSFQWDIGVNDHNRLRIIEQAKGIY
jgi:hypothetical protein